MESNHKFLNYLDFIVGHICLSQIFQMIFSKVNFKVQVIKGYYREFFEGFVEGVERWYEVKRG